LRILIGLIATDVYASVNFCYVKEHGPRCCGSCGLRGVEPPYQPVTRIR